MKNVSFENGKKSLRKLSGDKATKRSLREFSFRTEMNSCKRLEFRIVGVEKASFSLQFSWELIANFVTLRIFINICKN